MAISLGVYPIFRHTHIVNFLCRWDDSLCRTGGWSDLFPRCRVDPTGPWGGRRTTTARLRCDSTRKKWGKNRAKSQVLAEIGMEAIEIGQFYQQELWLPKTSVSCKQICGVASMRQAACRLKHRRWGFRKTFTQKGTRIWPAICDAWLPGCFFNMFYGFFYRPNMVWLIWLLTFLGGTMACSQNFAVSKKGNMEMSFVYSC